MSITAQIQELLNNAIKIPIKDAAGIILPNGIDNITRIKTLQECLRIIKTEENKDSSNDI